MVGWTIKRGECVIYRQSLAAASSELASTGVWLEEWAKKALGSDSNGNISEVVGSHKVQEMKCMSASGLVHMKLSRGTQRQHIMSYGMILGWALTPARHGESHSRMKCASRNLLYRGDQEPEEYAGSMRKTRKSREVGCAE